MTIDPDNPIVALCVAGMALEGDASRARELFAEAWAAQSNDYEASIAAHFLARHQETVEARLEWNLRAVQHAEAVADDRVRDFMASLYLNLGDAHLAVRDFAQARAAAVRGHACLVDLPPGGYRDFVARGIDGLQRRITEATPTIGWASCIADRTSAFRR